MITLRCTRKLLRRLGVPARTAQPLESGGLPQGSRLGDWHANLLFRRGGQIVIFVNDRSLLPVLVPARPKELIARRLVNGLAEELRVLGVDDERIAREAAHMVDVQLAPTNSRRVLGTMNDFMRMLDDELLRSETLVEAALRLAEAPCGPIGMSRPRDIAVELLQAGE